MSAAAAFEIAYVLGKFTVTFSAPASCTATIKGLHAPCEWEPRMPRGEERADLRLLFQSAKKDFLSELAAHYGPGVLVVARQSTEPHPAGLEKH